MTEQLEILQRGREGLIARLNTIEEKRREIKASTIRANRMRGVSKQTIAGLRIQDTELLREFNDTKRMIGEIKEKIKQVRMQRQGEVSRTLAEEFIRVAKGMMPKEMFDDIMVVARERAEVKEGVGNEF